ncbi:MAG: hypothetical protein OXS32_09790 [Verrucomicrobiales bacterium]|nr:hypothetical protein [Verrucomicrobiales bacterium]|tara:strand:- start:315 stop:461 length:147 start_codon:yes stop_codon:yes gene_type:complete
MRKQKEKSKTKKQTEPDFVEVARRSLVIAQKKAARENARYGLKLIVEN